MLPQLLIAGAAVAATWREIPKLAVLAEHSTCVVTGVVRSAVSAEAAWGLVTTYEIDVEDTLAGSSSDTVTLSLPGGRTDAGLVQAWSGVPVWSKGDEVLVFVPPGARMPLTGVFTLRDHEVVDPLGRWGPRVVLDSDVVAMLGEP